jgi:hypothetical protein
MSDILARVTASRKRIEPESVDDFVGLQICRALADDDHAYDYLLLARRSNSRMLISAFHAIQSAAATGWPVLDSFAVALGDTTGREDPLRSNSIIAVSFERHRIAIVVFRGLQIEHHQVRYLSSDLENAERAATGLLHWALSQFNDCSVVVETGRDAHGTAHAQLSRSLIGAIRATATPFFEVNLAELLSAYRHPACIGRGDFRRIVAGIWPALSLGPADRVTLDALGLGLSAQVTRELNRGEPVKESE